MGNKKYRGLLALGLLTLIISGPVYATDFPTSSNYRFDETSIGLSNLAQSSSANFVGQDGAGDIAAGESNSTNFSSQAGSDTSADPNLAVAVTSPNVNFGTFNPTGASTATATFTVMNYTSYGYVVQIAGTAPTYNGHAIASLGANANSQIGIEQFGLNLVANTSPISYGANPNNGGFGFGQAATNYNTPNSYRFVSGETIAQAPKSSGVTVYTISYLVNVAALTPGGQYNSNQTLIVTGTY
jgi:hypothetical protein